MDGLDDINPDAQTRIEQVEKRLNALQELGQDTAALRSQLAFARTRLVEGAADDALRICDEVLITARRLANGSGEQRIRTVKITRDELTQELHTMLSRGLFARLLAEHQQEPGPKLEARLEAFDLHIREYLHASHRGLADTCAALRQDLDRAVTDLRAAMTEQATARAETAEDGSAVAATAPVGGPDQAALAQALSDLAERLDQRLAAVQDEQVRAGAAWRETLQNTVAEPLAGLRVAAERLSDPPAASALTGLDATVRDGLAGVRDAVQAAALDQDALLAAVRGIAAGATAGGEAEAAGLDRLVASLEASQMALIEGVAAGFSRLAEVMERSQSPVAAAPAVEVEQIRQVVRDELGGRLGGETVPRLVQQALGDPATVERLLGLIALEAVSHPGVLGELTGLRAFLRRELRIAVEAYAKDALPV